MPWLDQIKYFFSDFFGFTIPLLLRKVVTFVDGLIYTADAELYDLIVKIAKQEIFSKGTLNEVAGRVYQLLALIMIFRLIFLFVTYVVNPDDMLDKTKGYQNVIRKMVITLGLIIITPWAFAQARVVQQLILEEGIIEYFVFGQGNNANVSSGYEFMHTVGMLFVTPYKCSDSDTNACATTDRATDNVEARLCEHAKWDDDISVNGHDGSLSCEQKDSSGTVTTENCKGFCGLGTQDTEFQTTGTYNQTLYAAANPNGSKYDLKALMSLGGEGNWKTHTFYAEYKYPFIGTTLIGIFIGYMLIVMCIDIALRSVKLSFYELIAPVPIVSYIGPKDGKETMLNKWFSQVLKTYAELFVRIAGLEIAVFFIDTLLENETLVKSGDFFVELFLILGALTFAKKLPDILKDLGIKFEGGTFNLKKKFNDDMFGSKYMKRAGAAGLALAGGAAANTLKNVDNRYKHSQEIKKAMADEASKRGFSSVEAFKQSSQYKSWKKDWNKEWRSDAAHRHSSVIGGSVSSAYRAATSKDGKVFAGAQEGVKGSVDRRDLRDKRENAGYSTVDRALDSVRSFAGVDTKAKTEANKLRDEISEMQTRAYGIQQNAQNQMNSILARGHTQKDISEWLKIADDAELARRVPATVLADFKAYKATLSDVAKINADVTKANKKLGLYEQEKK